MHRPGSLLLALGALGLGLAASACHVPPPAPTRLGLEATADPAPRAPAAVPVRLAEVEGALRLELEGLWGPLVLERAGPRVRASDGREALRLAVEPGYDGLVRHAGRAYPGTVWVEAHPDGGLRATAHTPLEEYLGGVVAAELVLWSARVPELEAQAVAARSYALAALAARGAGAFLWSDTRDQVYRGRFEPSPDAGSQRAAARLAEALRRSAGRTLQVGREVLDARFHASCGGHGAAFADVFPLEAPAWARPGQGGAPCPPCARLGEGETAEALPPGTGRGGARGRVRWTLEVGEAELAKLAAELDLGSRLVSLRPTRVDDHGRWLACELVGERSSARLELGELRRRLGYDRLLSGRIVRTRPRLGEPIVDGLYLEGLGRGHGVGLCQTGARELAAEGWSAEAILGHYYPDAGLSAPAADGRP